MLLNIRRAAIMAAVFALVAAAQVKHEEDFIIMRGPGSPGPATMGFVSASMGVFEEKLIAGAPYSAEAVSEFVQTLGDGTRITRRSSTQCYRDGQGRTRRELGLAPLGGMSQTGEPPRHITIHDPVAKLVYMLNPADKTARKMPMPGEGGKAMAWVEHSESGSAGIKKEVFEKHIELRTASGQAGAIMYSEAPGQTEQLGKQTIEGVVCEGTRATRSIPAGQIGNDRPIQIVTERWYSPDLQTVVMSRITDPLNGDVTYKLTAINRAEPPADLFQIPADYTVMQANETKLIRRPAAKSKD